MTFERVRDAVELRRVVAAAIARGKATVVVEMFESSSRPFDELVKDGFATGYAVLIEVDLVRPVAGDRDE